MVLWSPHTKLYSFCLPYAGNGGHIWQLVVPLVVFQRFRCVNSSTHAQYGGILCTQNTNAKLNLWEIDTKKSHNKFWLSLTVYEFWVLSQRWSENMPVAPGYGPCWATCSCTCATQVSIIVLLYFVASCLSSDDERTAISFSPIGVHHLLTIASSIAVSLEFVLDGLETVFERFFEESCTHHWWEEYIQDSIAPSLSSITDGLHKSI